MLVSQLYQAIAYGISVFEYLTVGQFSSPVRACSRLRSTLGADIVKWEGEEYMETVSSAWNLFNTFQRPACVVYPRESDHVQIAMREIYENKVRYAVQAGGHSGMVGWNNVQNGILITFAYMKEISYDEASNTITLQPGARWGEAIAAVEPYGVAPVGGRVPDVGTGLLLGGGISYLAGEYGFSSDTYQELDVVLVTGELVTATASNKYSDLFKALKGGGNRFGIVTRYVLQAARVGTKEDKEWYGGFIMYPETSAEDLVRATADFVENVNDPKAALMIAITYTNVGGAMMGMPGAAILYHGTFLPEDIYGEFLAIPSIMQSLGQTSYFDAMAKFGLPTPHGSGHAFGGSALYPNVQNYQEAFLHFKNYTTTFTDDLELTSLAFTPVQQSQIAAGRRMGGNVIDPPDGPYGLILFESRFKSSIQDVSGDHENGRKLLIESVPPSTNLPLYLGESDAKQNAFNTYGGYEFLKKTYAKYDPNGFNLQYTDGPLGL